MFLDIHIYGLFPPKFRITLVVNFKFKRCINSQSKSYSDYVKVQCIHGKEMVYCVIANMYQSRL